MRHTTTSNSSTAPATSTTPATDTTDTTDTTDSTDTTGSAGAIGSTAERTFASYGLPQRLVTALERRDIRAPFAIQSLTLPDALAGRDILGRAQTGSGKTLAFGVPMLARLAADPARRRVGAPRGLVLVPTRELAGQVRDALEPLGHAVGLKTIAVFGGASMGRQIDALRKGVDVVVATPGRLLDLIDRRECSLDGVEITVLDEADYMADLGFLPVVRQLLDGTRADGQRLLFSATLDGVVDTLVRRYLSNPATHSVAAAVAPIIGVDHHAFTVRAEHKLDVVAEIAARPARTLLFVRTKHGAERLAKQLRGRGVEAGAIHGNLTQNARQRALEAFATGRARVLVATDVAARGIHVDDVDLVVHVDPAADHKDYLHRSGRTARAGASGAVVSLLLPAQRSSGRLLLDRAGVRARGVDVAPGHPAVRAIAESGEPVVVLTPAPSERFTADESGPRRARGGFRREGAAGAPARGTGTRSSGSRGASRRGSDGRGPGGAGPRGGGTRDADRRPAQRRHDAA
jgi:superfamily II DNA/RNA helicase